MSQSPDDANHNSYRVQNVNVNLLRSQFTNQSPVMDPLYFKVGFKGII